MQAEGLGRGWGGPKEESGRDGALRMYKEATSLYFPGKLPSGPEPLDCHSPPLPGKGEPTTVASTFAQKPHAVSGSLMKLSNVEFFS